MQNWSKSTMDKGGIFETRLNAVNYSVPPYSEAYPLLAHYWEDDPAFPRNNVIEGNVFYRVNSLFKGDLSYAEWNNNYMAQKNPGFKDEDHILEGFTENALLFEKIAHFHPIPFEKIGCDLEVER